MVKVFLTSTTVVLNHFAPLPFNSALPELQNAAEARKLFIPRALNGALHPINCNLDHVKELHVFRSCRFAFSRLSNSFSFQLKMKDEKKCPFALVEKLTGEKFRGSFEEKCNCV